MKYTQLDKGDDTVLEIDGALDAVTASGLRPVFEQLVSARRKSVTLELSSLRLIDSTGVGTIMLLWEGIREYGGRLKIVGLRDQPRAIFRLMRLDRIFPDLERLGASGGGMEET